MCKLTRFIQEPIIGSWFITIVHLRDGVMLLPRPEYFVKMLSYSNLSSLAGIIGQLEKLA